MPLDVSFLRPVGLLTNIVLRGLGQVMFQGNRLAGLLFLAGIAANSWLLALAALAGTLASTLAALMLGADRRQVQAGMFGFNGALVGIALLCFLAPVPLTWACVVLAASFSTVLMAAFGRSGLPALTAPFVFVSLTFFLSAARFGRLETTGQLPIAGLPVKAGVEGVVTVGTLWEGLFTGVGQVFFQGSMLSGVLFLAGLFASSWRAGTAALVGSLAGMLVAWGMGAAEPAIRAGAFGFNGVLTTIALAAVFPVPGRMAAFLALAGAVATPFVAAACAAALEPLGLPALTLPFVLTTWVLLLAGRHLSVHEEGGGCP